MTEDQKAILALTKKVEELEAENKQLRLDAHTKDAFYGGRIEDLEAENADLRKLIKREQELRKNYHNEETAKLRDVLRYIRENSSCGVARQWAKKAEGKE